MKQFLSALLALAMLSVSLPAAANTALAFDCSTVSEIPLSECEALMALYDATGGENWINDYNWFTTNTPSNWHGVRVNAGHVMSLDLTSNHLVGTIPPEIGNLTSVTYLELVDNQLQGSIPVEIANMTDIFVLHLSGNQLTGNIPVEFGNLTRMWQLFLSHNALTGTIPAGLGNMVRLENLDLSNNQLTGTIPPELGNLSLLWSLWLSGNHLEGDVPAELANIPWLADSNYINSSGLNLQNNHLRVPLGYPNPTNPLHAFLEQKDPNWDTRQTFGPNGCSATVSEIPQIECEALVALYNNTGGPNWNYKTNWLVSPKPSTWQGITVEAGRVTKINLFSPDGFNLTGSIPPELSNLASLKELYLTNNYLTGSIPSQFGDLANLERLSLAGNRLTGSIPPELGSLASLKSLYLYYNQLSGSIPSSLGSLSNLTEMHLYNNQLTGAIPPELGSLANLRVLRLQNNQLSGDVPVQLSQLPVYAPGVYDYGLDLDYNRLNVPDGYPVTGSAFHTWLATYDLEWHLRQAFEVQLQASGGTVTSQDGDTEVTVPSGALSGDATFTFMPQAEPSQDTGALVFAQTSFQIEAADGTGNPITSFSTPLTVTIHYTDDEIQSLVEEELRLYYWDTQSMNWLDAVSTCPNGVYTRDLSGNTFSLPICHFTEFAVLGNTNHIYLPLVTR